MPNFRAVLFDVDNTLLDFMAMKTACCEAAVKAMIDYGLPVQKDDALRTLYGLFDELGWENRQIFDRFLERVHGKVDERIIANGIVAYRDTQRSLLKPYASVIPTLMAIREAGVATAIISDAPNRNGWIRLVETGLQHFFDTAVYSHALRRMGTPADSVRRRQSIPFSDLKSSNPWFLANFVTESNPTQPL